MNVKNCGLIMGDEFRNFWFEGVLPDIPLSTSSESNSSYSQFNSPTLKSFCPNPAVANSTKEFIDKKRHYVNETISNISSNKEAFIQNYRKVLAEIEEMTRLITNCALNREKELKNCLQRVALNKIRIWDKQLKTCNNAIAWLLKLELQSPVTDIEALDQLSYKKLMSHIGSVDDGEIKFDVGDFTVFKVLQGLGRISFTERPKFLSTFNQEFISPKLILGADPMDKASQLCRPWGVCCDVTGRVLVTDRCNHRVLIFDKFGEMLFQFGKLGSENGEFRRPAGIAVDNSSHIIVADKDNHRVQVFSYCGGFIFTFGNQGDKPGEFNYPWDVAVNSYCDIAVSDSKNHRVQLFSSMGVLLSVFPSESNKGYLKKFDCPRGLAFRPDGFLLVTDFNNHKIVVLNENFRFVKTLSYEGSKPGQLYRPQGITCLNCEYFAVSDSKNYRVQIFDMNGNFVKEFGTRGSAPGQFDCPQGIACHPDGYLLVVDLSNNRIQMF